MPYAKIVNGRVVSLHDSVPPLPPKASALFVECAGGTQIGWSFEGGQVVEPGPDAEVEAAILGVTEAYDVKRKGLKDRMAIALLQDGESEMDVRAALAVEWQQANADEELEILSLIGG